MVMPKHGSTFLKKAKSCNSKSANNPHKSLKILIDHAEKQNIQVTLLTQPVAYPVDGASK